MFRQNKNQPELHYLSSRAQNEEQITLWSQTNLYNI